MARHCRASKKVRGGGATAIAHREGLDPGRQQIETNAAMPAIVRVVGPVGGANRERMTMADSEITYRIIEKRYVHRGREIWRWALQRGYSRILEQWSPRSPERRWRTTLQTLHRTWPAAEKAMNRALAAEGLPPINLKVPAARGIRGSAMGAARLSRSLPMMPDTDSVRPAPPAEARQGTGGL